MPIYEYACPDCDHQFEHFQKMSDPLLTVCPSCEAEGLRKLVSATSFHLKGGGWYKDHYGLKSGSSAAGGESSDSSSSGDSSSSDSGDSSSSDSSSSDSGSGDSSSSDSGSGDSGSGGSGSGGAKSDSGTSTSSGNDT